MEPLPPPPPQKPILNLQISGGHTMAQMKIHCNTAPLKLDGANTQIDLGGNITTLEGKKWTPDHDSIKSQILGEYAVMEHNRRTGSRLKFVNTYECWSQVLPCNLGIIHILHLVATDKGVPGNYEACVWEKSHCPLDWGKVKRSLDSDLMALPLVLVYFIPMHPLRA